MRTVCVIESLADFQALQKRQSEIPKDTEYFCASAEIFDHLTQAGLKFSPLTEDLLESQWDEINVWAKRASLRWFEDPALAKIFTLQGLNLGNVFNRPLSHVLIYRLKNLLLADHLLDEENFDRIVIFNQWIKKGWIKRKDGGTINEALDRRVTGTGKIVIRIFSSLTKASGSPLKDFFRRVAEFAHSLRNFRKVSLSYAGMGDLKYLLPVLSRLQKEGVCAFIDGSFQWASYKKCKEAGITYVLAGSLVSLKAKRLLQWRLFQLILRVKKLEPTIAKSPRFIYREKQVDSLGEAFVELLRKEAYERMRQPLICQSLAQHCNTKALVLHEDVDAFRAAALAARQSRLSVVVLSHGIPPTPNDWSEAAEGIGVADTLVNSEFEKEKYLQTGHPAELLHVTGLPRYDLIRRQVLAKTQKENIEKIVLYCPHMLTRVTKRKKGYLGIHTPGAVTRQNSMEVMKATEQLRCKLLIKPHANSQDLDLWKELVQKHGGLHTELVSHRTDIFDLLAGSDLVIATFSTVVIEAMLFGKNVITLNFTGRPDIHPYAQRGIAVGVYDSKDLRDAIEKCLNDSATQASLQKNRDRERGYFGGPFDGENTERAVQFIRRPNQLTSSEQAELRNKERVAA